jgi:hypothetical protein
MPVICVWGQKGAETPVSSSFAAGKSVQQSAVWLLLLLLLLLQHTASSTRARLSADPVLFHSCQAKHMCCFIACVRCSGAYHWMLG